MIVLSDNDLEIGIYPDRCIEAKNYKKQTERSIRWSEVKKSAILRHLTEKLMSRLDPITYIAYPHKVKKAEAYPDN